MLTRARDHGLRSNRSARRGFGVGLVESYELGCPLGFSFAEWSLVNAVAHLSNGMVQFLDREELPVAQRRDDPALDELNTTLDLALSRGL
jgi:hypothetical protein